MDYFLPWRVTDEQSEHRKNGRRNSISLTKATKSTLSILHVIFMRDSAGGTD